MDKNAIIFVDNMSSSVHIGSKKEDILIFGKSPAQGLHDTSLTAEVWHSINFSRSNTKFCLSLHYNVNGTKICQFKAIDSE